MHNVFSSYGTVAYVSLPRYRKSKKIKEFAFVEFEKKSDVQKTLNVFEEFGGVFGKNKDPDELQSITTYLIEQEEAKEENEENEKETDDKDAVEPQTEEENLSPPPTKRAKIEETDNKPSIVDEEKTAAVETTESEMDISIAAGTVDSLEEQDSAEDIADENVAEVEGQKKKKKRMRRKKPETRKDATATDSFLDLKIMTKQDWKRLRNKYLNLQREKIKQVKQQLRQRHFDKKSSNKGQSKKMTPNINFYGGNSDDVLESESSTVVTDNQETVALNKTPLFSFESGLIVSIKFQEPCIDIKDFKGEMRQHGQVKYVDVKEGDMEAFIRVDQPSSTGELIKQIEAPEYECKVLTGDAEDDYWNKIKRDREDKIKKNIKVKPEKMKTKILKKNSTHIRFDGDDD